MGEILQRAFIRVPGHSDVHDHRAQADQGYDRGFSIGGEGRDGIDLGFDVVQGAILEVAAAQFQRHDTVILRSLCLYFFYALDALDRFFNSNADPGFHLRWCGAQVGHGYRNRGHLDVGELFLAHLNESEQPAHNQREHQQIRRDGVSDKPADETSHDRGAQRITVTGIPSTTYCRVDTQSSSPACNPSVTTAYSPW